MLKQALESPKIGKALFLDRPLWVEYLGGHTGYHFLQPLTIDIPVAGVTAISWHKRIEYVLSALKSADDDTARHCQRVSNMALALGAELNLPVSEIKCLCWSSLLHDIGKIIIDPRIKNKPAKLTPEEYGYIRCHAMAGGQMVRQVMGDKVAEIIEHHHDHYDGSGLHQLVTGEGVPLGARILAVADAFDAMTSDRSYRTAMSTGDALEEIKRCSGTQFDPAIINAFLKIYTPVITGLKT